MGVSVREKQKGSGVYWVFIRHAGQRVSERVGDLDLAEDAAAEIRRDIRRGTFDIDAIRASRAPSTTPHSAPPVPTLEDYYERFERDHRLTVRPGTIAVYENAFRRHILPAPIAEIPEVDDSPTRPFGSFRLDEITRGHVKAFVTHLVEKRCTRIVAEKVVADDGTESTRKKTVTFTLAKPSLRIILSSLTTCLTNAEREDGLISSNPALALGRYIKQAKPRHESIDPLGPEEVPVFLEALQQVAPDFGAMFLLLLHTGIRSGECAALEWGDVDFRGRYLVVERTLTPRGRIEQPKNGRVRKVDLSDAAIDALKDHRKKLQKKYLKKGKPLPDVVFPNSQGRPHSMTNVRNRVFHAALKKAGLHRRPLHATRHTFATLLLMQGESPVYVKDQMGHSSIKITVDVYGKWMPSANRTAVNRLPGFDHSVRNGTVETSTGTS